MTDQDKLEAVVDFKEELITLKQDGADPKDYTFSYGAELDEVFKAKCGVWRVTDEGKLSPLNNVKANTESLKDRRFLEVGTVKYRIVVKGQAQQPLQGGSVIAANINLNGFVSLQEMAKALQQLQINELDHWNSENRSVDEQVNFKEELIQYYGCNVNRYGRPYWMCMLTGLYVTNQATLRASHIFKACTRGVGLHTFALRASDINSPRNGLLLFPLIEEVFDHKGACFLYNPFSKQLNYKILNPALMTKDPANKVTGNLYLCECDGKPLILPDDRFPFRRLLKFHARCAFEHAIEREWINASDYDTDIFDLSDVASVDKNYLLRFIAQNPSICEKAHNADKNKSHKVKQIWVPKSAGPAV